MDTVNISNNMDGVYLKTKQPRTAGQKHGDLRMELLREGLTLLDTKGIAGVTVRAVARNAGVAHSAPANHFASRQAMLTAIATIVFSALADQTIEAIAELRDKPEEAIQAFAEACFQFAFATPNRYQLLWQRQLINQDDPVLAKEMDRVYEALLSLLRPDRVNHPVDIETDAIAIWSMIHGYISMRLDGNLVAAEDGVTKLPRHQAIMLSLINGIDRGDS